MALQQEAGREQITARIANRGSEPLAGRLGINVPQDWWASAPLLKSYEAAGFDWVQLHAPPLAVLEVARLTTTHAVAAAEALATTSLRAVLHAPGNLRAGSRAGDRAFQNLLSYAAELGGARVVYHALAVPDGRATREDRAAEERSLGHVARLAERLDVTIAIENLAPVFPAPEVLSATPATLRGLAQRVDSPAVGLCLDLGHAHISAELRHTSVELLCEPVVDRVVLFHLHDNLGARLRTTDDELGVDPLRLDLHLPPGRGTLPWERVASLLAGHAAPLLLEVHPPFRPQPDELNAALTAVLA